MAIIPALVGAGVSLYGSYKANQARDKQIAGLRKLRNVTPAERDYEKRRRDIIQGGDPTIEEAGDKVIQKTRQEGQFQRQTVQGQAIQQGLEGSIVAQELRRKVDDKVLKSVAEQARKIALANAEAKKRAELELEGLMMRRGDRNRQISSQIAQIPDKVGFGERLISAGLSGASRLSDSDFGISDSDDTVVKAKEPEVIDEF
tara:strand:+ start:1304 stop:1909 length:606 start_codon:yes stop_codon:yes gene_type:complete